MSGFMSKFKNIFVPEDEYDDDDYEEMEEEQEVTSRTSMHTAHPAPMTVPKVVSLNQPNRMELLNFTMLSYDMTGEICGYIKNKKPIIVNMEKLVPHEMQRAVDYLTGACFALNGTVEKVTDNIFIFAPEHVNINPEKIKQRTGFPPTI
ncbi:MAG: cell division protein SepF [Candidatus Cellulosilyticum pullistercoris]|uniref:Cell division protein SepF n=1 Tax=Candidatus Cellulosilyticum pullistercoris TaxID=2838521 RepID=A0A9E2KEG0_9FIRM|nr:cell division protein SepF [Candidatus Cellulosilyticum pullistercoris]